MNSPWAGRYRIYLGRCREAKQFEFESENGLVWVDSLSLSLSLAEISETAASFPGFIKSEVCKDF